MQATPLHRILHVHRCGKFLASVSSHKLGVFSLSAVRGGGVLCLAVRRWLVSCVVVDDE